VAYDRMTHSSSSASSTSSRTSSSMNSIPQTSPSSSRSVSLTQSDIEPVMAFQESEHHRPRKTRIRSDELGNALGTSETDSLSLASTMVYDIATATSMVAPSPGASSSFGHLGTPPRVHPLPVNFYYNACAPPAVSK
jgi:hypothetical protein